MFQPEERKKRSSTDPFWILHRKYLQCDFGERNFKYTWNQNENFTTNSFWNHPEASQFQPHTYNST